jgi:LysM repeat protein
LIHTSLLLIWLLISLVNQANVQAQSGAVSRSELILAMNTLRVSHGLPPLIEDPIINSVAQTTAEIMAANYMSWHIGNVRGRIAAAGYGGGGTVWATENFAVGRMTIDEIMQAWSDPDHMRPAVNPAYCHVGAGVAQAGDGRYYYVLQAAYVSGQACGEYQPPPGDDSGNGGNPPPISQIITPVEIATPDAEGRIYHIVQAGQSFWSIAIAYQITIRDLEIWNNLSRDNDLLVGQKLFIPSSDTEGYATPTPLGMVLLATPDADGKIVHEVQPYQALIMIAQAYHVKVDEILVLNGLQVDWPLQIGQKLLIDPGNVTPSPTHAHSPLSNSSLQRAMAIIIILSRMVNTSPGLLICTMSI